MIDYEPIIEKFYAPGSDAYRVLYSHSRQVADLARTLCKRMADKGVAMDEEFVYSAAMLHDIGIFKTNAPGIYCYGTQPYVCHGIIGAELMRELGLPRHALVCERHTGSGISAREIIEQHLPIEPPRDLLPISLEEKVVCYADKFFSKSHTTEPPKSLERVRKSLQKFGGETLARFDALVALFGEP